MKSFVTLSFIIGASALRSRSTCPFELTASGGESGTIGQLNDGQNRIGGDLSPATYTISNGGIIDAAGRGCILTPEVEQFQCDQGVGPTYGFSIDSNGTLEYSGGSVFYACPSSDYDWNIYTTPVVGQQKCVEITLAASACAAEASPSVIVSTVTIYNCGTSTIKTSVPVVSQTETYSTTTVVSPSVVVPITYTESETYAPTTTIITVPTNTPSVPISYPESGSYTSSSTVITVPTNTLSVPTSYPETQSWSSIPTTVETYTLSPTPSPSTSVVVVPPPVNVTSYSHSWVAAPSTPTTFVTTYKATSSKYWASTTIWSKTSTYSPSSVVSSILSSSTCIPTTLTGSSTSGNYQYPHLIVPVSSSAPTTAYGTSYFGTISSNTSTLFNFDIPTSYSGKTCSLIFLLPLQSQLETSAYTFSGSGGVEIEQLSSAATTSTTWDTMPSVSSDLGDFTLTEGSSTLISTFSCPAGETVSYEISAVGDTYLNYFQDWNPSPLGLYITFC